MLLDRGPWVEAELVLLDRGSLAATAAVGEGQGGQCHVVAARHRGSWVPGRPQAARVPEGKMGRRFHFSQTSRIESMSACASDEAVVNLARSAAADEATAGAMRLSSRGGNWGGKDAIASKDN